MSDFNWKQSTWSVVKELITRKKYLVQHQIDSYNEFLDKSLSSIITQLNPIVLNYDYVENQMFFKFKDNLENHVLNDWIEYSNTEELYKIIKMYIIKNSENKKIDLLNILTNPNIDIESNDGNEIDYDTIISFIEKNLELKKHLVNKHRYKLEIYMDNHKFFKFLPCNYIHLSA